MDEEVKKEWEKSKRIEAERMKAAKALEEDRTSQINSAFLESENPKVKGFSRDASRIARSVERATNFSLGFVIFGIILMSLPKMLMGVGLGLPVGILLDALVMVGLVLFYSSPILAGVSLGFGLFKKDIAEFKAKDVIVSAVITLVIFGGYLIFELLVIK